MKSRYFLMFIIAVMLAGGAAWLANKWVQSRATPTAAVPNTAPVVVAAVEIPFGYKIEAAHLKTTAWPKSTVPSDSFSDTNEVVGKIAKQSILPNDVIFGRRIAEHLGGSTLSALINPTMRAISVRVNDVVGVAGFILPGNYVDVLATKRAGGHNQAETRTLLENIRVLAVDQEASPDKEKPAVVRAVTLEMLPEQAEKLVKAMEEGTLQLTLRNPLDSEKKLAQPAPAPAPKKKAARVVRKPEPVTVIRGTQVNHEYGHL